MKTIKEEQLRDWKEKREAAKQDQLRKMKTGFVSRAERRSIFDVKS
jgi:hypothetical protein